MNIAEYSIRNKVISWLFVLLLLVGGYLSFNGMGQLEFPEFTIKQAMVITQYPGASPEQVEEEVTITLEQAIQQLPYVENVITINSAGLSQITVEILKKYDKFALPQIWDELRRKIGDAQSKLPPGVKTSLVVDDFGDVFGILYNIKGPDYSYRELEKFADLLKRELIMIPGVKKIGIDGTRYEVIAIEISRAKLNALGLDPNYLYNMISTQNVVSNAGRIFSEGNSIRIHPSGEFKSVEELGNLIVSSPGAKEVVRLSDLASIERTYQEVPTSIYTDGGSPAISLGIAFSSGVNVVEVGAAVDAKLKELESRRPLGLEFNKIYDQPGVVKVSVGDFLINLVESIAIVFAVLLVAMGIKAGLLIGGVLLLTILGTSVGMYLIGIQLQLISLGALIIALGMLVDNAIVVTEGIMIGVQRGMTRMEAAKSVVTQTQWPLLGATIIAIIAFAPIGLSQDNTGEFCRSLFQVLLISLFLSWVTAITLTPFFCNMLFKDGSGGGAGDVEQEDPYKGMFFVFYKGLLSFCMRFRVVTLILVIAAMAGALGNAKKIRSQFFPPSTTPIFFVDFWMPEGTDIRGTQAELAKFEAAMRGRDGIVNMTSVAGKGMQRFILPYSPEKSYASYGLLVIEASSLGTMEDLIGQVNELIPREFPEVQFRIKPLENGPAPAAKIEARFYGSDPTELRRIASDAMQVIKAEPTVTGVRHDWRNQVSILRPEVDTFQARRVGVNKTQIDKALLMNFSGMVVGVYREASDLLPIIARSPDDERLDADSITDLQLWSNEYQSLVPITQVVSSFDTYWENPLVLRRNRERVISVLANPILFSDETTDSVLKKFKTRIEAISLPEGYRLEWGGELEKQTNAKAGLFSSLPGGYLAMFLITIFLFNTIRQPLAIWATVPLALIGVVVGLVGLNIPFSFMALLGLLSLSGMVIKNGIVLVDQINLELSEGKEPYDAVFDSAVSRVRPVCMAALTTMLGMIPLLFNLFFAAMAVTIIFGLGFATILTLLVLPVVYALLYRIKR